MKKCWGSYPSQKVICGLAIRINSKTNRLCFSWVPFLLLLKLIFKLMSHQITLPVLLQNSKDISEKKFNWQKLYLDVPVLWLELVTVRLLWENVWQMEAKPWCICSPTQAGEHTLCAAVVECWLPLQWGPPAGDQNAGVFWAMDRLHPFQGSPKQTYLQVSTTKMQTTVV